MGLFSKKKSSDTAVAEATKEKKTPAKKVTDGGNLSTHDVTRVILKPHVTEKAAVLTDKNVYTFVIAQGANKHEVSGAIRKLYNVTPRMVRIVNQAPRRTHVKSRGRWVTAHGMRKAYVYLKTGDRIELV